jgi:hypothetical protein
MARPLRLEGPGYWFHVTGCGNARGRLFLDGSDRRRFVELLSEVESRVWAGRARLCPDDQSLAYIDRKIAFGPPVRFAEVRSRKHFSH